MKHLDKFTYGDSQAPHRLVSLRRPKGEQTQEWWIAAAFRDKDCTLISCRLDGSGLLAEIDMRTFMAYPDLWTALATFDLRGSKAWLIGWRVRHSLDAADFIGALAKGEIALPKIKAGKNKGKHGGKLTVSRRIMEVDVVCGKNKIKLLDFGNFGVLPECYVDKLEDVTGEIAAVALRDYLESMDAIGVQVSKTTAAQVGWNHFRVHHQQHELAVNLDTAARRLERAAYHGGRCECFRVGEIPGTTYSLDVRSCYATICRDELLPVRLIEEYRRGLDTDRIDVAGSDHWIADVVVSTDEVDYPLQWEGSPIFPVGTFRTALPWPELKHALRRGRVLKVLRAARYAAAPALRAYAEWYLNARCELAGSKLPFSSTPLKAMFNASLGYSAREKYEWVEWSTELGLPYWIGTTYSPDDHSSPVSAQKLGEERRWLRVSGEPREAMPFLHATITSYARVRLAEIIQMAGRENVLYCDTDGVLVSQKGERKLRWDGPPGQTYLHGLVERFPSGSAIIRGQKSYSVGDNVIQAGAVKTRHSGLKEKHVLTVTTGRVRDDGRVEPFRFTCEDQGGEESRWVNNLE
jgi:hypothetical protein